MSEEKRTEAEEVREILDVVSDRIPALLKGLRDVLYSKEAAEGMADAVATFYKKLTEAGIPQEVALEMAQGYMINLRDLLSAKGIAQVEAEKEKEG
ncbi:MAG TPA: hypothetical protein ENI38_04490 [Candidatus Acetothermia bacterium]|nr:hypothetical protein [Candidatus Acetothermia bacterium]